MCVVWVVWERRLTFGSRFDLPITIGTVLFGAGVGLTAPWPVVAGFPFPFTGKYFLLIVISARGRQRLCRRFCGGPVYQR